MKHMKMFSENTFIQILLAFQNKTCYNITIKMKERFKLMTGFYVTVYQKSTMEVIDQFVVFADNINELKKRMSKDIQFYEIPTTDIYWVYEV